MKHTVTEHKLASGAQGLVIDIPGSEVVNIVVRFNSGYQFADPAKYEVPHLMEHLLDTVSEKYPKPNGWTIELQKNGAFANAQTYTRMNSYIIECANFELERILGFIEEQLLRPLFAAGPLTAEIGNVREELNRNISDHSRSVNIALSERAFPGEAMNYPDRIAQLGSITVNDMAEHYRRTHTAHNARFFVAGSFTDNGAVVSRRLEQIFNQLPSGERFIPRGVPGIGQTSPIITERNIPQYYYAFEYYGGGLTETDRMALSALRLMLNGGFRSRILGELRERGLAYTIGMSTMAEPTRSQISFGGFVMPSNAAATFEVVAKHLKAAVNNKLTEGELRAAKRLGVGSTKLAYQTVADILAWYMGVYDRRDEIDDFDLYLEKLELVTLAQVQAAAAKILSSKQVALSVLGNVSIEEAAELQKILETIWQ